MDINLKVSPAELEAKATDFKGVMSQIKTLTDNRTCRYSVPDNWGIFRTESEGCTGLFRGY